MKYSEPTDNECLFSLIMGVFFTMLGVIILFLYVQSWLGILTGLAIGGLGVEAIISARKKRNSIISKIGPLP